MSLTDDLYRETILDHYHQPRNQGELANATVKIEGVNPLCGDEITLYFNVDDKTLSDVKINSHGCSINTASGSIMTECVKGQSLDNVKEVVDTFKSMMLTKDDDTELPEEMEDLECLRGVKKYPVRIKCALLPWNTLQQGLERLQSGKTSSSDQYVEK